MPKAPSVVRAQTSKGKVRFAYLQLGWSGSEIIHKEDLLAKHGWQAEYSVVPGSPVPLLNQLTTLGAVIQVPSFALFIVNVVWSLRVKVGHGLVGAAVQDGKPILVNDVRTDPRYVEAVPGSSAELVVPLRRKGKVIGAMARGLKRARNAMRMPE